MHVTAETELQPTDIIEEYGCSICKAQATGYHFGAQSCSACAAFFRRTVALRKHFRCTTGNNDCFIHYSTQICRACRFKACLAAGMKQSSVQPKKSEFERRRTFCTRSGLKRNKKFALRRIMMVLEKQKDITISTGTFTPSKSFEQPSSGELNEEPMFADAEDEQLAGSSKTAKTFVPLSTQCYLPEPVASSINDDQKMLRIECDVFKRLIKEEMKLGERRRILFCERPVGVLLGLSKTCPFTADDIKPLKFCSFRKSIRTHILLIYEWLRCWPTYEKLNNIDRITILRNCVLYHTILDPAYVTVQIGYPKRFVMHNGQYLSATDESNEGWEDEQEISGDTKKRIYRPLMRMLFDEIVVPMVSMKMCFEEFVALKAFISLQSTICEVSSESRPALRAMFDALCKKLHQFYVQNKAEVAERFGNLILLLSNILIVGQQFVERHHEIAFFDLWHLDSLLLQLLKKEQ